MYAELIAQNAHAAKLSQTFTNSLQNTKSKQSQLLCETNETNILLKACNVRAEV